MSKIKIVIADERNEPGGLGGGERHGAKATLARGKSLHYSNPGIR